MLALARELPPAPALAAALPPGPAAALSLGPARTAALSLGPARTAAPLGVHALAQAELELDLGLGLGLGLGLELEPEPEPEPELVELERMPAPGLAYFAVERGCQEWGRKGAQVRSRDRAWDAVVAVMVVAVVVVAVNEDVVVAVPVEMAVHNGSSMIVEEEVAREFEVAYMHGMVCVHSWDETEWVVVPERMVEVELWRMSCR